MRLRIRLRLCRSASYAGPLVDTAIAQYLDEFKWYVMVGAAHVSQ